MKRLTLCVAVVVLAGGGQVQAEIVKGGFTFDDNAFADTVISSSYQPDDLIGAPTIEGCVTNTYWNTWFDMDPPDGDFVEVGFTDNLVVNGSGNDLVFFEQHGGSGPNQEADPFHVSLIASDDASAYEVPTTSTAETNGAGFIAVGFLDLTDLGVASGATLDRLFVLTLARVTKYPEFIAVGALNSVAVPAPSTLTGLVGMGIVGLIACWRRRN